jgi:anaerobic C4-dicarboxylate transporter
MSTRQRRHKKHDNVKRIARITKKMLISLVIFLLAIILVLIFRVGDFLWPSWMIESRNLIAGILSFIMIFLILLSPIIIEFNSNPRPFSGPGKDPRQGWNP